MTKQEPSQLKKAIVETCKKALEDIILDPEIRISDISVETIVAERFGSPTKTTWYVVRVTTNNASMVRGSPKTFKGSYKERVEGILAFVAKKSNPQADVHLEIAGPNLSSVESVVTIPALIRAGKVAQDSPLISTARKYSIPYALLRGRHIVGPNPALAKVLQENIVDSNQKVEKVLDLFAGTGISAKVLCQSQNLRTIDLVEDDSAKIGRMKEYIRDHRVRFCLASAFQIEIRDDYDLVVADPYFEDIPQFLDGQLRHVVERARTFILVSGGLENVQWNNDIYQNLEKVGLNTKKQIAFGQMILVGTK